MRETSYVCCPDCKRGIHYKEQNVDPCSCGWKTRSRKFGCYVGDRIEGAKARKGEQGYTDENNL